MDALMRELHFVLKAGRLGAWALDLASGELTTSEICRSNFGRDPKAPFTYEQLQEAVHPEDRARMSGAVDHAIASGADYDIEYRIVTPAGDVRWVLIRAQPSYGPDGAPLRMTGVSVDITDRKRSETRKSALVELSDAIRDNADPDALAGAAAGILGRTLGVSRAGYGAVDPDNETLHVERGWNAPGVEPLAGMLRLRDHGSFVDGLKRGELVAISDVREDARAAAAAESLESRGARSFVNAPVVEQGRLRAVLYVDHGEARDWTADDLALVEEVAERMRTALERIRSDDALRELNETLESRVAERTAERDRIWQLSGDMLGVADIRGVWLSINPAWPRILGWRADEIVGRTSEWMEHPDDQAKTRSEVARLAAGRTTFEFENRFRSKDAGYRTLSWTAVPDNGLLYCVGRDVTEARLQEAQALEQIAARERTWTYSPDLLSVIDMPSGTFQRVNPAWTLALGWTMEEVERKGYRDFVHPDDVGASAAAFARVRGGNPVLRFENRYRHKDGGWRWLSWVAFPEGDKLYSSSRDVTDDKERASALRLFENIVESASAPICAFDMDFRLIAFNKAHSDEFFRIFAYRVKLGDVFPDLFPADQAPVIRGFMARALAGEVYTVTEEFGDPNLAKPYWEVSYSPIRNAQGEIIGAFHYAQDISQRLRAQAELEATQEALRQSQKTEAIGQLTGGVAHDFNNLLTVIRGSIDLMRRGSLPEERRQRHMQAIADTVTRATRLTHQLLAFARRQTLQPEAIDVGRNMRAVAEMLATLTGSRIEIIPHAPAEPCFVNVDPSQFDTALVNMAVNARDAMAGEGTLTIRVQATSAMPAMRNHPAVNGEFVEVSLSDTGSGIPADQLDRIFEPFFTTKAAGAGTGLGLSQVFGFAKQSGGEVMVESVVGEGTTFTLYLPRIAAPAQQVREQVAEDEAVEGGGACVLLVEDNEEVGSFATQALIDLGYVAVWASDASEALAELDRDAGRFDVVFSDVIMPGMNGVDLAQEIRRRHPGLPVVLTSGYSSVLAEGGTHGFEMLHKPYSVEQMSRALAKAAARSRRSRDASPPA